MGEMNNYLSTSRNDSERPLPLYWHTLVVKPCSNQLKHKRKSNFKKYFTAQTFLQIQAFLKATHAQVMLWVF